MDSGESSIEEVTARLAVEKSHNAPDHTRAGKKPSFFSKNLLGLLGF